MSFAVITMAWSWDSTAPLYRGQAQQLAAPSPFLCLDQSLAAGGGPQL